jgi:hypothetical protein
VKVSFGCNRTISSEICGRVVSCHLPHLIEIDFILNSGKTTLSKETSCEQSNSSSLDFNSDVSHCTCSDTVPCDHTSPQK